MEHEYYSGLSIIIVLYYVATRLGSQIGNMIDKEVDKYELVVNSNREGQKKVLEDTIALENKLQESMAGQLMLQDAKKENVRLGFVPDEWFLFFQEKTGVTGPYVFLVSISSFLISKEYYVMEHEYYSGLSIIIVLYYVATRLGSQIGNMIDKEVDKYELVVNSNREGQKKVLEDTIALENKLQESMAGQLMLQDAKKENVHLQLEAVFRERLLAVYKDVKRRLDFQISKVLIEKSFITEI
ncbi:mitochondrial atp synthase b chain [Holotrichia oblita]|uniref:Mitochondrial atp synthase b chain n=1 Tax=Holotrichia oblita TaxID=644536 RepID=A0ACB9TN30_HOLOL|nr:mitochondrial atp synthase b chain [Holotrichia oblita]